MNEPLISVIVPVYNVEKYLNRCIDSILSQTYTNFELLLINDGSSDKSGEICDEYAFKDSRVKVFHKDNGGVTAARADGVRYSNGEWVTFVDADDSITDNALGIFGNSICDDYDIIRGNVNLDIQNNYTNKWSICSPSILSFKDYRSDVISLKLISGPWACLVRKTLFNQETFNVPRSIVFGEDLIMHIRLAFENVKNVKVINETVYNYIQNTESCVHTFKLNQNYIREWYGYILKSIPQVEIADYECDLIRFRMGYFKLLCKNYIKNNKWNISLYHKDLLNDIRRNKKKLNLSKMDIVLMSFSNPITSIIYLCMCKIGVLTEMQNKFLIK